LKINIDIDHHVVLYMRVVQRIETNFKLNKTEMLFKLCIMFGDHTDTR